jgi:hypothetical protein
VPISWLAFAFQYTDREGQLTPRNLALLFALPLVTLLLAWTNEAHGLIWSSTRLSEGGPFSALEVDHGAWFWVHWSYSYLLLLIGTILLVSMLTRSPNLYRKQNLALLVAVSVPWVGNGVLRPGSQPCTQPGPDSIRVALEGPLRLIYRLRLTTTLALISGCISQWYLFFPVLLKVCVYLLPGPIRPESNEFFLFAVTVCAMLSLLIHVTFVPRLTVIRAGLKLTFWIEIVLVGCFCALAVGCLCAPEADTANSVPTTTRAATVINKMMRLISVTSSSYFSRPTGEICTSQ